MLKEIRKKSETDSVEAEKAIEWQGLELQYSHSAMLKRDMKMWYNRLQAAALAVSRLRESPWPTMRKLHEQRRQKENSSADTCMLENWHEQRRQKENSSADTCMLENWHEQHRQKENSSADICMLENWHEQRRQKENSSADACMLENYTNNVDRRRIPVQTHAC
jgi:hypothetical protein